MKVLRKIFGPLIEGDKWRVRTNGALQMLFNDADLVTLIKIGRLILVNHVHLMGNRKA